MSRRAVLATVFAASVSVAGVQAADDISAFPGIDQLPEGYRAVDGFVSGLGKPYALGDTRELPTPPIYWTHKDKIIGFEVIVPKDQIDRKVDLRDVQPIAGLPSIDHLELMHYAANPACTCDAWVIRVEFVSAYYLERMF